MLDGLWIIQVVWSISAKLYLQMDTESLLLLNLGHDSPVLTGMSTSNAENARLWVRVNIIPAILVSLHPLSGSVFSSEQFGQYGGWSLNCFAGVVPPSRVLPSELLTHHPVA